MGYTHYMVENSNQSVTTDEWSKIVSDFEALRSALPWIIDSDDPSDPMSVCNIETAYCDETVILFNGIDAQGNDLNCETSSCSDLDSRRMTRRGLIFDNAGFTDSARRGACPTT